MANPSSILTQRVTLVGSFDLLILLRPRLPLRVVIQLSTRLSV